MIIKRQKIYVDLMDAAVGVPATEIHRQRQEGEEGMSTGMKVAGATLAAGALAFAGHRGYLGGHMMKWTNKGLYKAGNLVGSNTLMNKGAQGYLAGSMKTGGVLTGKGAREFYKTGSNGVMRAVNAEGAKEADFFQKGYLESNSLDKLAKQGSALGQTNKNLGLGKDNIGKFRSNSVGTEYGTRNIVTEGGANVTDRFKAADNGFNVVSATDKNKTIGTVTAEVTENGAVSKFNPAKTEQQTQTPTPATQS